MKKLGLIPAIVLLGICASTAGGFDEVKTIPNHAFALIQSRSGDMYVHIQHDDCTAGYRAVVNQIVLGEGTIEVGVKEVAIPFGHVHLHLRCSGDEIIVRER
jgi:hypothetical protein